MGAQGVGGNGYVNLLLIPFDGNLAELHACRGAEICICTGGEEGHGVDVCGRIFQIYSHGCQHRRRDIPFCQYVDAQQGFIFAAGRHGLLCGGKGRHFLHRNGVVAYGPYGGMEAAACFAPGAHGVKAHCDVAAGVGGLNHVAGPVGGALFAYFPYQRRLGRGAVENFKCRTHYRRHFGPC